MKKDADELLDELEYYEEYALEAYMKHGCSYEQALELIEDDEYYVYFDCRSYEEMAEIILEGECRDREEVEQRLQADPNLIQKMIVEIKSNSDYAYEFFDDTCIQLYLDSVKWHRRYGWHKKIVEREGYEKIY